MEKIDILQVCEHPETVTEEFFRHCSRHDQFMILDERPDFLTLFVELNGPFTRMEEFELIMSGLLTCEEAQRKAEFTGHDIREFIIEGVLRVAEFMKMNYAERLTGDDWSAILGNTDFDNVWKDYCEFSKFSSEDWEALLEVRPEYAEWRKSGHGRD